jgi:hypothetical protein
MPCPRNSTIPRISLTKEGALGLFLGHGGWQIPYNKLLRNNLSLYNYFATAPYAVFAIEKVGFF